MRHSNGEKKNKLNKKFTFTDQQITFKKYSSIHSFILRESRPVENL